MPSGIPRPSLLAWRLWRLAGAALVTLVACSPASEPSAEPRGFDQVVLVTIDTLRADHLGSYGYSRNTSPFLDRLAEEGVVFTNARATSGQTSPSHASILTGLVPSQHGVLWNGRLLDPELSTLATYFRQAGHRTAAFIGVRFLGRIGSSFDRVEAVRSPGIADAATRWLAQNESPTFLWVHLYDLHSWRKTKRTNPRHLEALRQQTPGGAEAFARYLAELHGVADLDSELLEGIDHYDARILHVDEVIEKLLDEARRASPDARRLWIITADHGEGLGSHGDEGHLDKLYDEQLRIPLIVHASEGVLKPGRVDAPVSTVNLLPTLLESLGATAREGEPPRIGGSLWPLLRGREDDFVPVPIFSERSPKKKERPSGWSDVFSLVQGRHKYIYKESGEDEFFDLATDPKELRNLGADAPESQRLRRLLEERVSAFREQSREVDDTIPDEILEDLRQLGYIQ